MTPIDSETKWCADLYDQCAELHETRARAYRQQAAQLRRAEATGEIILHHQRQMKQPPWWHNPDNAPPPGDGWRFLLDHERTVPNDGEAWYHGKWNTSICRGMSRMEQSTYRTKQPLP